MRKIILLFIIYMELYVSLGGCCISGFVRKSNIITYQQALPFDFIRSKFSGIIELLKNDFNNFLPKPNTPAHPDSLKHGLYIYYMNTHAFYHHNLLDENIYNKMKLRINRFKNLLSQQKEIIFFRFVASKNISDETNLKDVFLKKCLEKYPDLHTKIIFIGFGKQDITEIFYQFLGNNCFLFIVPHTNDDEKSINICSKCIYFFDNNKNCIYNKNKLKINSENLTFFETDLDFSDENLLYLDHCSDHK